MRSTRSSFRARTSERGFALALAVVLAVLYFGLIQLLMMDASRQLADARRFRSRIVALTHAENGAELAAANLVTKPSHHDDAEDALGNAWGTMSKTGPKDPHGKIIGFRIEGRGEAIGVVKMKAKVLVDGELLQNGPGWVVRINWTDHTQ